MTKKIVVVQTQCVAPGCKKCLPIEHMWLPADDAMNRANGGKPVDVEDFPRFALCGYHGHLLRETGVRVYRYAQSVARRERDVERREAQTMAWQPFASQFAPKANGKADGRRHGGPRGRDGRNVGGGLARCSKLDAEKRKSEE
jgi:hypothetical protein